MKLVKNLVFAVLLGAAITVNVCAGEMDTPPSPEPPPQKLVIAMDEGTTPTSDPYTGEITTETSDYVFFEMLAALLSVY